MQFDFGQNWANFSANVLNNEKIQSARAAFVDLLGDNVVSEKSFVDIGFGQGLSLLIATELGAKTVGCDINIKCDETLKRNKQQFFGNLSHITIPTVVGSILDPLVLKEVKSKSNSGDGKFDIVHSWGVLHHTGDMNTALKNTAELVKDNGLFIVALYNKHWSSLPWKAIKWFYCKSPSLIQKLLIKIFYPIIWTAKFMVTRNSSVPQNRGMDFYYDIIDWVGGYPYEYISIQEMKEFMAKLGFDCIKTIQAQVPTGCNEFIFVKKSIR